MHIWWYAVASKVIMTQHLHTTSPLVVLPLKPGNWDNLCWFDWMKIWLHFKYSTLQEENEIYVCKIWHAKVLKISICICLPGTPLLSVQMAAATHIFVHAAFPRHTTPETSHVNSLSVSRPLERLDQLNKHPQQPSRSAGKSKPCTWWLPEWAVESNRRWYFILGIQSNWCRTVTQKHARTQEAQAFLS